MTKTGKRIAPKRISANVNDVWYRSDFESFEIYLDGVRWRRVVRADSEEGHIDCYVEDDAGRIVLNNDGSPRVERLTGRVEIRPR